MIKIYKCLRCGHEWASRRDKPLRCARCKTPYWHIPRNDKATTAKKTKEVTNANTAT